MDDRCSIPGCRGEVELVYLDHGVCAGCWDHYASNEQPPDALKKALGTQAELDSAMERTMAKKTTETTTTPTTEAAPKPKRKRTPKSKKPAAETTAPQAETTSTEEPKPKRRGRSKRETTEPKPDKPELVVFAFRLTQAERDAIHQTSGPRNATQFVRRVAVAFAQEDEAAFRTVIQEARELRS